MSPKTKRLPVGLTALGLFGSAAFFAAAGADGPPAPQGPPTTPATAPADAPPQRLTVLLLYNGRVLQGDVVAEGDEYALRGKGGVIRFKKDQVDRTFASMHDLYLYKRSETPERDPDDRLKLARWCLSNHLNAEAKAELLLVLKLSPTSTEAQAMLASIQALDARKIAAAKAAVDTDVRQTAATADASGAQAARPGELDSRLVRSARKQMGPTGLPEIFDLPPAVAVPRADQFARTIHGLLQVSCAGCHNAAHDGQFQLIEVKSRRTLTPDVVRANLDATLRMIDPNNLAKSDLLTTTLLPHGSKPNSPPIFRGSSDPKFRALSAWVLSLRPPTPRGDQGFTPSRFGGGDPGQSQSGGFASDRSKVPLPFTPTPSNIASMEVAEDPAPNRSNAKIETVGAPPSRFDPARKRMVTEAGPPKAGEFPDPMGRDLIPAAAPRPNDNVPNLPEPGVPATAPPIPAGIPNDVPTLPEPPPPDPNAPKTPKKPVKIAPDLLKSLLNRNSGR